MLFIEVAVSIFRQIASLESSFIKQAQNLIVFYDTLVSTNSGSQNRAEQSSS